MKTAEINRPVKLTVVVPCFNEKKTLAACIERLLTIRDENLSLEIIIVDDCSMDGSIQISKQLASQHPEIILLQHEKNQGKGASLRTGFTKATGEFVTIQDADLECDPADLKRLLVPLIENKTDVVFGSRFLKMGKKVHTSFWHYAINKSLTILSNIFSGVSLTDMECCYKMFRRKLLQQIEIEENRFGVEPELVAKVARINPRISEMAISYRKRAYHEGKKIGIRDGFRAIYCIIFYNTPLRQLRWLKNRRRKRS